MNLARVVINVEVRAGVDIGFRLLPALEQFPYMTYLQQQRHVERVKAE